MLKRGYATTVDSVNRSVAVSDPGVKGVIRVSLTMIESVPMEELAAMVMNKVDSMSVNSAAVYTRKPSASTGNPASNVYGYGSTSWTSNGQVYSTKTIHNPPSPSPDVPAYAPVTKEDLEEMKQEIIQSVCVFLENWLEEKERLRDES